MADKKLDTITIAKAIADTARKFGRRNFTVKELLPFARCVEITLNNSRDVPDTTPAVRFCAEINLPVCFVHLGIPHNEETIAYAAKRCLARKYKGREAKFSQKIFHLAFSKINMWGEKYGGIGRTIALARDFLKELSPETIRKIKKLKKQRMVFLGDSIMATLHWGAYGGYPDILSDLFGILNRKVEVINAGIGGQTSWEGLARLERDVTSKKPDMCFVAFGANDLSYTKGGKELKWMAKFRKSMTAIVTGLKKKGVKPVFLNGTRQSWIDERIYRKEVADAIVKIGRSHNVPVIDSHGFSWKGDKRAWLCFDDVHLNNSGQIRFAGEILKFILEPKSK